MFEDELGSRPPVPPEAPARFVVGDVIDGRYEVLGTIGRGGMGTVLHVKDRHRDAVRALKYCHETGDDLKRFAREVRIMEAVEHDNVVPILSSNLEHDPPYFVMPLARGSLEDEIDQLKADEPAALEAFRAACLGLQALHTSGIVHRDNKPENILRFARGNVAVSDLGLAKPEARDTTTLTRAWEVFGTRDYLAPEQREPGGFREADVRTDVFQMGKVLYRLLTGRSPQLIDPSSLPRGLSYIVERATRPRPEDRYQDMGELLDALGLYDRSRAENDSQATFESLVDEAEELLKQHRRESRNIRGILEQIARLDPAEDTYAIRQCFDRVPTGLLPTMASDFSVDLLPVLKLYREAIRTGLLPRAFEYADSVAVRMRIIFRESPNADVKVLALETLLHAAVEKNRYYAMGVFNTLLAETRDVDVALPVAEMLKRNADRYRVLAKRVARPDKLQAAIRAVREEVLMPDEEAVFEDRDIPF